MYVVIFIVALGMFLEWFDMTKHSTFYLIAGIPIISIPIASLLMIAIASSDYRYIFLTYLSIIWSVDSAAMFGGKAFGGPKLAPYLSPNKTWSGLLSGVIGAIIVSFLLSQLPKYDFFYDGFDLVVFASIFAVTAQMSDLFVSFFKRKFRIKDTGSIIPGHGGVLDRCDSMIFTAPMLLWVVLENGQF